MKEARDGALGACLVSLVEQMGGDEYASQTDARAALLVLGETILMWRRSMTKG